MAGQQAEPHKRPSIYDVAALAGVSHMTVSRVLNDAPGIKDSTRARVQLAIAELDCRPSSAARTLATRRAMRIGTIVHGATLPGPNSALLAIEKAAREVGYSVSPFSSSEDSDAEEIRRTRDLQSQGVDALCIVGPRSQSGRVIREIAPETPLVVVGSHQGGDPGMSVDADQVDGARRATEHLLALGHRSIAHLSGPVAVAHTNIREAAWRLTIVAAGLVPGEVIVGDWSSDSGYRVGSIRAST